jgi:hypothetical protein
MEKQSTAVRAVRCFSRGGRTRMSRTGSTTPQPPKNWILGRKTYFFKLPATLAFLVIELDIQTINLEGEWIGYYPGHFDEVVRISQTGDQVECIKITGDDYVPAEAVTWRASLLTLRGEGQVAEHGFRNPRFVRGRLTIINHERIQFKWENCGEVEFRKDE